MGTDAPLSHIPLRTISSKDAAHDSQVLRRQAPLRVKAVIEALSELEKLAMFNPTKTQQDAMLNAVDAAVAQLRERFANIAALQVSLGLEDIK